MISFQNVSFTYAESGNGGVLDLNLVVRSGECVLLCGPSGCGKTTVTRLANGLIPHFFHGNLSGQVNVNGMDTRETEIAALSDAVGTVFQNPRTQFFNTDTDSEIVFGLENRGIPRETLRSRLDELTEELHLSELRGRNIFELSGGEKQKIAFSSVYASAPDVLVFDEPSSNLDMKAIGELADLIQRAKISGKTILIAEHRIWYLMDIVDRVVYMAQPQTCFCLLSGWQRHQERRHNSSKARKQRSGCLKRHGVPMGQTQDFLMASGSMRIIPEYSGMRVGPMVSRRSFGWNRKLNVQS